MSVATMNNWLVHIMNIIPKSSVNTSTMLYYTHSLEMYMLANSHFT